MMINDDWWWWMLMIIRRASAQGVSDHQLCALDIDSSFVNHFVWKNCNGNKYKQHFRAHDMRSSSNFWNLSSNCCFLFEKCAREAASLGASGHVHSSLFAIKWGTFFETFPKLLVFTQNCNFVWKMPPTLGRNDIFRKHLLEKMWKLKSVFGLRRRVRIAYEPIPWSARGNPNIEEQKSYIS